MPRPKVIEGQKDARERIVDAFWAYALRMPLNKISVGMLSAAAGCNRSTFYYYFDGLADLFERAMDERGLKEILAGEFAAALSPDAESEGGSACPPAAGAGRSVVHAAIDDLCTLSFLNRGNLDELGAAEKLLVVWEKATGFRVDAIAPERRALLEFATRGFLGMLAYRGSTGNSIPFESLSLIMRHEVAPYLIAAIEGRST